MVAALYQEFDIDRPPTVMHGTSLRYRAQIETPSGSRELFQETSASASLRCLRVMTSTFVRFLLLNSVLLVGTVQAQTVEHYRLELRPDFEARVLHGLARIRLQGVESSMRFLHLRSPALSVSRVRLDAKEVAFERAAGGWQVSIPATIAKGSGRQLEVEYSAPATEGLVFGRSYVYTAFNTCRWLPCLGSDLARTSFDLELDLPDGYKSVASGRPLVGSGIARQRWVEQRPYPIYTLGFAAGEFAEAFDPETSGRLRYLGAGQDEEKIRSKLKESARVLAFLEQKAGIPIPSPVYAQVLVPGEVAQEASSFSVIGDAVLDPVLADPQEDWVVVHEMAHQWWGNLLTCSTWSELWLNEGIVVFMTAAWKQERWGEAAYQRELALARQRWHRAVDAGLDKPLSWAGHYPSLSAMRAIHYSKGALFMHALRVEVGEEPFWAGLREYTRSHAGHDVTAKDLQKSMEAITQRSLGPLFDAWVY